MGRAVRLSPSEPVTTVPPGGRGGQAEFANSWMRADLDGVPWRSSAGVQALRAGGLIAISGVARDGSTIALALRGDCGEGLQRLESSPANAVLTTPEGVWRADGISGGGYVRLFHVSDARVEGSFKIEFASPAHLHHARIRLARGWFVLVFGGGGAGRGGERPAPVESIPTLPPPRGRTGEAA
jgi:hypothetical protein